MSLLRLRGDPALCHPSQPKTVNVSTQRSKSPELRRPSLEILDHSRLSKDWHLPWKRNLRGAADILHPSVSRSPVFQKPERKNLIFSLCTSFTNTDMGISFCQLYGLIYLHIHLPFDGFLSVHPKVVLIVLMIMCHSDMSRVGCRVGLPATRQGDDMAWCCVVL